MTSDFKASGAFGLGRKDLRNGVVEYLVTDEFGFGACKVFYDELNQELRFFEPSEEELFKGLFGLLGVVDVPSYTPTIPTEIVSHRVGTIEAAWFYIGDDFAFQVTHNKKTGTVRWRVWNGEHYEEVIKFELSSN